MILEKSTFHFLTVFEIFLEKISSRIWEYSFNQTWRVAKKLPCISGYAQFLSYKKLWLSEMSIFWPFGGFLTLVLFSKTYFPNLRFCFQCVGRVLWSSTNFLTPKILHKVIAIKKSMLPFLFLFSKHWFFSKTTLIEATDFGKQPFNWCFVLKFVSENKYHCRNSVF